MSYIKVNEMDAFFAIGLATLLFLAGNGIFLLLLEKLDKKFFFMYLAAFPFLIIGASLSILCVLNVISGVWLIPSITAVIGCALLGSLILSFASEEKFIYRMSEIRKPLSPMEVEKGIDWKKVEKWLVKNSKK